MLTLKIHSMGGGHSGIALQHRFLNKYGHYETATRYIGEKKFGGRFLESGAVALAKAHRIERWLRRRGHDVIVGVCTNVKVN